MDVVTYDALQANEVHIAQISHYSICFIFKMIRGIKYGFIVLL